MHELSSNAAENGLRQRAEELLGQLVARPGSCTPEQLQELVHELEVHRVELELQNQELREAQHELEQSRDRYAALYDFAPVGYLTLDAEGRILEINLTAAGMLGMERMRLVGQRLLGFVRTRDKMELMRHLHECGARRQPMGSELGLTSADGRAQIVQLSTVPAEDLDGALQFRTVIANITQRKQAEEQLRVLNETLERRVAERTATVQTQAGRLRELALDLTLAEHRERQRIAQILHDDLQQILYAARLRLGQVGRRQVGSGQPSVQQVDEYLNQAIETSRALTGELSPAVLQDGGLARALEWLARDVEKRYGMPAEVRVAPGVESATEEVRVLVFHAARELLFNVVKHAHSPRAVVEVVPLKGEKLRLSVEDQGIGFDSQWLQSSLGDRKGFGLFGLRERLELLDGRLEVRSVPGRGAQVSIVVPQSIQGRRAASVAGEATCSAKAAEAAGSPMPAAAAAPRADGSAGRRIRVVLADDHAIVRRGLAGLLQGQPDLEVVGEAADGEEAVERVRQTQPDVVLMDITMPRLSGIEAARRIRAEWPQVRIIGLSMHEEEDMAAANVRGGAAAYVSKAGSQDVLLAAVRGQ